MERVFENIRFVWKRSSFSTVYILRLDQNVSKNLHSQMKMNKNARVRKGASKQSLHDLLLTSGFLVKEHSRSGTLWPSPPCTW